MGSKKNNRKLNVLMFGPNRSAASGISNVVNNWIENGIGENVNIEYVATLENCVPRKYFSKFLYAVRAYFLLFVKSRDPIDIVHIHMSSYMSFFRKWFIFKYSKWNQIKTLIHIHSGEFDLFFNNSNEFIRKIIIDTFDSADAVIVLSEFWMQFVKSFSINSNVSILYNGSSLKKFSGRNENVGKINILFMGRLGKRKGTYDLLPAFEKAIKIIPELRLILCGDGDVDQIRKKVSQMGLSGNVVVSGWISGEEKIRMFKCCDIYALPSYNEGLPGSILEAMAVGVPIISTPVGGIPEAVIENRNGFLITPGDVNALSSRIVQLGQSKQLREKMGRESKKIIGEKFEINSIVDRLENIYAQVAEQLNK